MAATYTLGTVLLVLGVLALLGGLGWAADGYFGERQQEDEGGVFSNPDDSAEERQVNTGLVIAGGGLVATVVGFVLMRTSRPSAA